MSRRTDYFIQANRENARKGSAIYLSHVYVSVELTQLLKDVPQKWPKMRPKKKSMASTGFSGGSKG